MPLHRRVRRGLALVPEERAVDRAALTVADEPAAARASASSVALDLFPELEPLAPAVAPGCCRAASSRCSRWPRPRAPTRLLLVDELSLGLAPLVVERLLPHSVPPPTTAWPCSSSSSTRAALDIADRVIVLRRGGVVLAGPAAELRDELGDLESAYLTGVAE